MTWSAEDKTRIAMELRWSVQPSVDDDGVHVVRVAELPGFIVVADEESALGSEYRGGLRAFLLSFFASGEEPPYPGGTPLLPWQPDYPVAPQPTVIEPAPSLLLTGSAAPVNADLHLAGLR